MLLLLIVSLLPGLTACLGQKNGDEEAEQQKPSEVLSEPLTAEAEGAETAEVASETAEEAEPETMEPEASRILTMEALLRLYEDGTLTETAASEGLDGFLSYTNVEPVETREESLTGLYACPLAFPDGSDSDRTASGQTSQNAEESREYELQIYYWKPETAEAYGHEENEIDSVLLMEKESKDAVLLYQSDSRYTPTQDLAGFLERDYDLERYLTLSLPDADGQADGYEFGSYEATLPGFSGWLLEAAGETAEEPEGAAERREPAHGEGIPEAWYAPGGIGRGQNASKILHFEEGRLTDVSFRLNHAEMVSQPEELTGCEVPALLAEYEFDRFTAAQWQEYLEENPDADEGESVSRYYYVFLGRKDSESWYVLFFNEELFSREDAVETARSIHFAGDAF
ncbi:MAG TPA: hypothetical protein H9761_07180 [Candidatus Eisenbergiella merdavium]|uniref:Uncharacterized protein n=1 Tax=Candidatus Eisenbergiella merdavium TaxID=2838551 RepID=A0A9D2NFJ2_9FIRM|nr:hypothetical protein [Candidatus Eisenbergiella merdavium]